MFRFIFLVLMVICFGRTVSWGQCAASEVEVVIEIQTDNFGYETSWVLTNNATGIPISFILLGTYQSATLYRDTFCVPEANCISFQIDDSYGDGLSAGNGYYNVIADGVVIATGGNFTTQEITNFNCPVGEVCESADTVSVGTHTATSHDYWYIFTPDSTGLYEISTCGVNSCDTKIWMYEDCNTVFDQTNNGTIFYDDNSCSGGMQAVVSAALEAGETYIIRIGDTNDDCMGMGIDWDLIYLGPIVGCMDPAACNYNPLATVSDSCIYPGSPDCPDGPDLVLLENVFQSSMYLTTLTNGDPCEVDEQCVTGMGVRDIIRFTTHIENNGTQDYYIGNPATQPDQFSNDNCHGHDHYEGYAEYILYDQSANPIPIGFKSGFCVIDLVCDNGGFGQYGCNNMGITAGCGDIYDAGLACQWIDITDVPDGSYTFVARVNWGNKPDALGRHELSYTNNWAQTCITIDRSSGSVQVIYDHNCPVYLDCTGQPYGDVVPDCNGICGGTAKHGDLNTNEVQELADIDLYLNHSVEQSLNANDCNDLFRDMTINIYDAALLSRCLLDTNYCDFPEGFENIADTVALSIANVDFGAGYIDIDMRNPTSKVVAYQFALSGVMIDSVVSLVNTSAYPVQPLFSNTTGVIAGLSVQDSLIERSLTNQPLCRIYFSQTTASEICIAGIDAIVNEGYQLVQDRAEGDCVQVPPSSITHTNTNIWNINLAPNPAKESVRFSFYNPNNAALSLELLDVVGQQVYIEEGIRGEVFVLERGALPSGVYFYKWSNGEEVATGRLVFE